MTLDLKPEIEQGMLAQARERGVSLDASLQEIVIRQVNVASTVRKLGAEEWISQFDDGADSFPEAPPIPDEALNAGFGRYQNARALCKAQPYANAHRAPGLRLLIQQGDDLCVTPQNIAEFWNVCTRPVMANGLGNSIAATDRLTARIENFFTRLIATHEVKGAKVHDSRLAAIMLTQGVSHILTFNIDDFNRYASVVTVHPDAVKQR